MHKKAAMLEDRGVISVTGDDATGFLQGLLTNDIEPLGASEARYAALLTPQGKILFDMIVVARARRRTFLSRRLCGRAGGGSRQAAWLLQAARQGRDR